MTTNSVLTLPAGPTGVLYEYFHEWELTPLRVTLIYLLLGLAALYVSDIWMVQRFSDPVLSQLQGIKGGVEVLATAGLIFGLMVAKERQVRRKQFQLDRQREELLVLHRVLRHNLRNDLNIILGSGEQIIREGLSDSVGEHCERIYSTAQKMLNYTEQAERIRQVTEQNGHDVEIDLAQRVPKSIAEHPLITDDIQVDFTCPETATIQVNRKFVEAIEELLTNAVLHNDGEPVELDISVEIPDGSMRMIEIVIADNGPGIPDEVIEVLHSSEEDQMTHLQGMGLWFVTWAVTESGGDIWFEDTAEGCANIRIQVPTGSIRLPKKWNNPTPTD